MDDMALAAAGILWLLSFTAIVLLAGGYNRLRY